MKHLMYSEDVTWEEYLLGADENGIEAGLLGYSADDQQDNSYRRDIEARKAVLRKIDQLKVSGQYENCRAAAVKAVLAANERAMENFEKSNPGICAQLAAIDRIIQDSNGEIDRQLRNLFDGLKSPDSAQAERFKAMYEETDMAKKTYNEVRATLNTLERAKVRRRKPSLPTPWTNEIDAMEKMRLLLAANDEMTVAEAARQADNSDPRNQSLNRNKRLERLYSQKMALRN